MQKEENNTRRDFLKKLSLGVGGSVVALSACNSPQFDDFLQKNFKTLSKEDIDEIVLNLEKKYTEKYGKQFSVSGKPAIDDTLFGYALDLSRCVGCRKCVYACVDENNQSRDPQIHWIKVLQMEKEKGIDFAHADVHYNPELVPEEGRFYVPVACQQCANPPCVKVCPAQATWQESDGIVVVDYNWCIGCRYCMAACPYGARNFNWSEPNEPDEEINPITHYLGNRPRPKGVVEKCTFCIQRVREGKYPSCVEICPTGSRKFGNLLDPESEIRYILENKRVLVLKAELNTQPNFFYFFGV
ncbi:MAG: 4Fe-4S dicluster domain-containing protein [Bacteroidales bacterium]|jgi:Fe-S-cluster-containing dehydrogenase component|nr:4Fe-4S dicluster domain-containing protein [Bacteroidales bacterium]